MYQCDDCLAKFKAATDAVMEEGEHFGRPFKEKGKVCPHCGGESYKYDQDED